MHGRGYAHLALAFADFVHDDVRLLDQFMRAGIAADPAHVHQLGNRQPLYPVENPIDEVRRRPHVVLGDPFKEALSRNYRRAERSKGKPAAASSPRRARHRRRAYRRTSCRPWPTAPPWRAGSPAAAAPPRTASRYASRSRA